MRYDESPQPPPRGFLAAGFEQKIMYASFRVRGVPLMASDGREDKSKSNGVSLALTLPAEAECRRAFDALADGGIVQMPLTKTFDSPCFGMVTDCFGLGWMVTVPPKRRRTDKAYDGLSGKVTSLAEAIEWVKHCPNPMPEDSDIEILPVFEDFGAARTPELREQDAAERAQALGLPTPTFQQGSDLLIAGLTATIDTIWTKRAPDCGLRIARGAPCLERYTHEFDPGNGLGGIEVWIPLGA
jgi:PhnB protein